MKKPAALPPALYTHVELVSRDPAATKHFLEQVFGWRTLDMPGPYIIFQASDAPHGGIRGVEKGERPAPLPHIQVVSIDDTLKRVVAVGGKVLKPKTEIPDGYWAIFEDPGGVVQALLEKPGEVPGHPL